MSGYLEVSVKGGSSAFIDASLVRGVAAHPKLQAWDNSTPDYPLTVFIGDNRELDVFGPSAIELLVLCDRVKQRAKQSESVTIVPRESYTVTPVSVAGGLDIQVRYAGEP